MPESFEEYRSRLLEFLGHHVPQWMIDSGMQCADSLRVSESYRAGNRIVGSVRDSDTVTQSTALTIAGPRRIDPECSCHKGEERWCHHAVALLLIAAKLDFFDQRSGFAPDEALFKPAIGSARDIAAVIEETKTSAWRSRVTGLLTPEVEILIDLRGDRLGVQVLFDDEPQAPALFTAFAPGSSRTLDNLLLELLNEHGSWDDQAQFWFVSSSKSIELILGLLQEYRQVFIFNSTLRSKGSRLVLSQHVLDAVLQLSWHPRTLELNVRWLLPDGSSRPKEEDRIGTGPFWVAIEDTLYQLSPLAARITSLFPHSATVSISKTQAGPVLEALRDNLFESKFVEISNPAEQPIGEVRAPKPVLELKRLPPEPGLPYGPLTLQAVLNFEYPEPPADGKLLYLPNREAERQYLEQLTGIGFSTDQERKKFSISGDNALDFLATVKDQLGRAWKVRGLEETLQGLKFAELSLNVGLSAAGESSDSTRPQWFDCHVSLRQNNANVPISTLFKRAASNFNRWVVLDSGAYARVPLGGLTQLQSMLGVLDANFGLSNTIRARLSAAQALGLTRMEDRAVALQVDDTVQRLTRALTQFEKVRKVNVSKKFQGQLRPYQAEGLSWLAFLKEFGFGGILADEMGLGKTIQALAFLQHLKDKKQRGPSLVVVPTSIVTNWLYETRKFCPELKVLVYHGPDRKRHLADFEQYDLVITSYALLRHDQNYLERIQFNYLILDEAQNIKNHEAATTKAAKALRASNRLALSGTPTENRPMELWSIFDFLMPSFLGSGEFFRKHFERPIIEGGPEVQATKFLTMRTRPFILRRTKAEVEKDLPPKIESVLHAALEPEQAQLYNQILGEVRPKVMDAVAKKGVAGASVSILAALLRLRQVCNHPNSISALREMPGFGSGKFELLKDLLTEALAEGRKILVYSQFIEMLSLVRGWLDNEKVNYLYLDGSTKNRQELVDRFNQDGSVRLFLMSLKAGGIGLNLTAADTVVIYDPWWNPAVENQAADRAHRIGQKQKVSVYRLVTENTVESKIMDLKRRKARMVDALINNNAASPLKLSKSDIENLFEFPEAPAK